MRSRSRKRAYQKTLSPTALSERASQLRSCIIDYGRMFGPALITLVLVTTIPAASAQWSANPGDMVRNSFGPTKHERGSPCPGACGVDCPSRCEQEVRYECGADDSLTRIKRYQCGTHQGCRTHDDCLVKCDMEQAAGFDCAAYCHAEVVETYGLETALSWASGNGPFDADTITFDYTTDRPDGAEASYTCPAGAKRTCRSNEGYCERNGEVVDPVFQRFHGGGADNFRVSGFRSGEVCSSGGSRSVCEVTMDILVTGEDRCEQQAGSVACTRFGFEMDYSGATASEPIYCLSTGTKQDFLGSVITKHMETHTPGSGPDTAGEDGALPKEFTQLFDGVQRKVKQGRTLEGALSDITITTEDGQVIGGSANRSPYPQAGVPNEIPLHSASGHVLVDMFELQDAAPAGSTVEHYVTCRHLGVPVVETTFRLTFAEADGTFDSGDDDCSCRCRDMASADELCAFFCEEEFAACGG